MANDPDPPTPSSPTPRRRAYNEKLDRNGKPIGRRGRLPYKKSKPNDATIAPARGGSSPPASPPSPIHSPPASRSSRSLSREAFNLDTTAIIGSISSPRTKRARARSSASASQAPSPKKAKKTKKTKPPPRLQRFTPSPSPSQTPSPPFSPHSLSILQNRGPDPRIRLPPPRLHPVRLTIDAYNVRFYAEQTPAGQASPWTSALSFSRFGGPRRHPPFRELHRLTEPEDGDEGDWAENVRWAREQWELYGSVWTEHDGDLERITGHRRGVRWVSDVLVKGGKGGENRD
ncbi:hypothetical protein EJ04DRAFT_579212 [Polyplosphaeria fusca]|uniref:Uncharacterized protein n=1 Tax=Polyplosphaeria fusca TaxID=682080 RepID=A0A9P4QUR6_9PLEO|nr:hypothetical protein EJ04DRAFT_579212 [Polyplosphaeria fusca]